jgi:hypothetical protein
MATHCDAHDQLQLMQSLLISLPAPNYLVLESLVRVLNAILEAQMREDALQQQQQSSAGSGQQGEGAHYARVHKLAMIVSDLVLEPLHIPTLPAALLAGGDGVGGAVVPSADAALRRAQEQAVLVYIITHSSLLFHLNPHRALAHAHRPAPRVIDVNHAVHAKLVREVGLWRRQCGSLKLNYSRRHFDFKHVVRAFRAWKAQAKSNRRVRCVCRAAAIISRAAIQHCGMLQCCMR